MKTIIKNPLFITVILFGCLSLTSCHQNDTITTDVKLPRKNRPANNLNADLFNTIDVTDIPDIEDDFSDLVAQVHNEAVAYMLSYLADSSYTFFTHTEAESQAIFQRMASQCVYEIAYSYNVDTTGFSIIANSNGDIGTYLTGQASPLLVQYLQAANDLCDADDFTSLPYLYNTYGTLSNDIERLIYKTYIAVAQYSYNYWSLSSYSAFNFLPADLIAQYEVPEDPPLFYGNMGEINWQNVAKADGQGAIDGVIHGLIEEGLLLLFGATLTWAEFAIGVGVHAAIKSYKAYKVETENCTIEIANPNHDYFQDPHSCFYNYMKDKYLLYGPEYLIDNWNGNFSFMIYNF
ncbi:MAG: hypothetical protein IKT19_00450 [Paludibacteraceae bacterium]|nr:hypothetical protein [Paludibacteraceae bacterium]